MTRGMRSKAYLLQHMQEVHYSQYQQIEVTLWDRVVEKKNTIKNPVALWNAWFEVLFSGKQEISCYCTYGSPVVV
jgi:hypothetical protein